MVAHRLHGAPVSRGAWNLFQTRRPSRRRNRRAISRAPTARTHGQARGVQSPGTCDELPLCVDGAVIRAEPGWFTHR
jgi:hypothetical protein